MPFNCRLCTPDYFNKTPKFVMEKLIVMEAKTNITVETIVNAPVQKVWQAWSNPEDIMHWNNASDDWHTPRATNDLRPGGSFSWRMESKDGSMGFDFAGIYDKVVPNEMIEYTIGDGRKVKITFSGNDMTTKVSETFETENQNPAEMQKTGWQAILDNFRKYVESK